MACHKHPALCALKARGVSRGKGLKRLFKGGKTYAERMKANLEAIALALNE